MKKKTKKKVHAARNPPASFWLRLGAALLSGLLIALSFPRFEFWGLLWVSLVPLLLAARETSVKHSFLLGLVTGTTANALGFSWMGTLLHDFGHLPWFAAAPIVVLGAVWQGLSTGATLALASWVEKRRGISTLWTLPLFYTALESFHPILFPWYLGNCQYPWLTLIQVCDILGISVLTFLVVSGNATLAHLIQAAHGKFRPGWGTLLFPILMTTTLVYGTVRLQAVREEVAQSPSWKLGVLEPEIDIFEAEMQRVPEGTSSTDVMRYSNIKLHQDSRDLQQQHPDLDLLLWPETCYFPVYSTWAWLDEPDWLVWSKDATTAVTQGTAAPTNLPVQVRKMVSHSRAHTLALGSDGSVWKMGAEGWTTVRAADGHRWNDMELQCEVDGVWEESERANCKVWLVGAQGRMAVLEKGLWKDLPERTQEDLTHVAILGWDTVVAVGAGIVVTGSLEAAAWTVRTTTHRDWVAVLSGYPLTMTTADGQVARMTQEEKITLNRPENLKGKTVAAASMVDPRTRVWATNHGLVWESGSRSVVTMADQDLAAVSCTGTGRCVAASRDGQLWSVTESSNELVASEPQPALGVLAVPPTRDHLWLRSNTRQLTQSTAAVPDARSFPESTNQDAATPERDQSAVQRDFALPVLFGALSGDVVDYEDPNALANVRYNSAFLIDEEGRVKGRYDKQFLLAFGEYLPFGAQFPFLYDWLPTAGRTSRGPNSAPLEYRDRRLGVLVCYEDILPEYTRKLVGDGVDLLLNLTNDAWFGKTQEARQHFILALFRAVEHRRTLVRSTTTGISGTVSPTGEILHMTDPEGRESFVTQVPLLSGPTLYQSFGHWFPFVTEVLTGLLILLGVMIRRKK